MRSAFVALAMLTACASSGTLQPAAIADDIPDAAGVGANDGAGDAGVAAATDVPAPADAADVIAVDVRAPRAVSSRFAFTLGIAPAGASSVAK